LRIQKIEEKNERFVQKLAEKFDSQIKIKKSVSFIPMQQKYHPTAI